MIKIEQLNGITIPNPGRTLQRTEAGRAIGHIPGWKIFVDPAYPSGKFARNRAMAQSSLTCATAFPADAFANAAPAFSAPSLNRESPPLAANLQVNPNAWSAFFSFNHALVGGAGPTYFLQPATPTADTSLAAPFVLLRADGSFGLANNDPSNSPGYLLAPAGSLFGGANHIVLVTFSTDLGLKVYIDGVLAASNTAYKTPFNTPTKGLLMCHAGSRTSGKFLYGQCGVLDIDLSKPENTGYRAALTKHLKDKYAIA